ncbi:hypothetical protein ONZ45_g18611 [Pleurotus djamor]|nr:hypothetical protein ONZ45_g18611 [Pleurotus djamor]
MDVGLAFPTSSRAASERSWSPAETSSDTLDTCTLRSSSEAPFLSSHALDTDAFPEYVLDIGKELLIDPLSPTSSNQLILLWELVLLHLFPAEEGFSVVHGNVIPGLVNDLQVYSRATPSRELRPNDKSQSSTSPLALVLISPSATTHIPASIHYHSGDILLNPPSVSSGLAKRAAYIAGTLARSSPYNKMLTITVHGPSQPEDAVLTGSYQHYYYPFHSNSSFLPNSLRGEARLNGVFPRSPPPSPTPPAGPSDSMVLPSPK